MFQAKSLKCGCLTLTFPVGITQNKKRAIKRAEAEDPYRSTRKLTCDNQGPIFLSL